MAGPNPFFANLFGGGRQEDASDRLYNSGLFSPMSLRDQSGRNLFNLLIPQNPRDRLVMNNAPEQSPEDMQGRSQRRFEGFRGPGGMMNPPMPENEEGDTQLAPIPKPRGGRFPVSAMAEQVSSEMADLVPEEQKESSQGGGILGAIGNFFTGGRGDWAGPLLRNFEAQATRDDLGLGVGGEKWGLEDNYRKELLRDSFRNAWTDNGFDRTKLTENLVNNGFGQEAFKIMEDERGKTAKIALEVMKNRPKGRVYDEAEMAEMRKKFPNARFDFDGEGRLQKITDDPVAARRLDEQAADRAFKEGLEKFQSGYSREGGGGRGPASGGGRIKDQTAGGRFPAMAGAGQSSLPQPEGRSSYAPDLSDNYDWLDERILPRKNPANKEFIKEKDRALQLLNNERKEFKKKEEGQVRIYEDLGSNVGELTQGSDGKMDFRSKANTGQFRSYVENLYKSPEWQRLKASMSQAEIEGFPAGFARSIDSDAEREVYRAGLPSEKNDPVTNYNIVKSKLSSIENLKNYRSFQDAWVEKSGSLRGSEEAWQYYVENNTPLLIGEKKGIRIDNPFRIEYKDYFRMGAQGAEPIRVNWTKTRIDPFDTPSNQLKEIGKNLKEPIDPNKNYMTRKGIVSGDKLIKAMGGGK